MASKCNKFVPNIFNKSKCQHCFGAKEAHSAEALENNKASRKVSKCGYLFVSPGFDFNNPLDRTKRWQRRFFILYDDGELTYSVDENPDTVPQSTVDMNKCTDVLDAEKTTTHTNSLSIITPEKTMYIKGNSKEEIQWWHDILVEFPKALKAIKPRRKMPYLIMSNKENMQPDSGVNGKGGSQQLEANNKGGLMMDIDRAKNRIDGPAYSTFRGVRSLKHKYDAHHQEGLRKSSSLHDLSTDDKDLSNRLESSRFLSRSGDRLDIMSRDSTSAFSISGGGGGSTSYPSSRSSFSGSSGLPLSPYCTIPKSTWTRTGQPIPSSFMTAASPMGKVSSSLSSHILPSSSALSSTTQFNSSSSISSTSSTNSAATLPLPAGHQHPHSHQRRGSVDDHQTSSRQSSEQQQQQRSSSRLRRERSSSLKDFPTQFSLAATSSGGGGGGGGGRSLGHDDINSKLQQQQQQQQQLGFSADETDSNETDELKMARNSSDFNQPSVAGKYEDLAYMKKGWLIKQGVTDKDCRKHWFVLTGNSLRYYKDAKAEDSNVLDGRIDLTSCYEVAETGTHRNYGFKIKTRNGEYVLAAMTSGIRTNWMKAIRLFMEIHNSASRQPVGGSSTSSGAFSLGVGGSGLGSLTSRASSGTGSGKSLTQPRTLDDFDLKAGNASISTAAVKGAGGETAFQLIGRKDSYRRDTQKPARRHHSDVNPGNVSKAFTIKEFSPRLDPTSSSAGQDPLANSGSSTYSTDSQRSSSSSVVAGTGSSPLERMELSSAALSKMSRFVEGSDSLPVSISSTSSSSLTSGVGGGGDRQLAGGKSKQQHQRPSITSESNKEEVKRAMMRRAKSPSARVRDKTRAGKKTSTTSRLTSPINILSSPEDAAYRLTRTSSPSSSSSAIRDSAIDSVDGSTIMADVSLSEEEYGLGEDTDHDDVASATTASDVMGGEDDVLVEILEKEVESLKGRLEHTQTELDKVHKDNMDLKSRYGKDSAQSIDSGYSGNSRWSQGSSNQSDAVMKRQLKEAKDTVQRQRLDIESLKSKLDMSVSKLTGTEKALSEALRDYKQEKDKFLKLSTEWNRRIRSLESNSKENISKLERSRENLQSKERECRRLEAEVKGNLQRSREQEKEVLKLKAVEHEYNQLKEKLDDKEHDNAALRSELKEKELVCVKMKDDFERQMEDAERDYGQERDDLEHHIEQLKTELYHAHDRQNSMTDNMTSNMADICSEKDDIIAQLEEKMIEADKKLEDLSDEFQAEMGENADLAHTIELLQDEKLKLVSTVDSLEGQLVAFQAKISGFQKDNFSLRKQLDELRMENSQLHQSLERKEAEEEDEEAQKEGRKNSTSSGSVEQEALKKTIRVMNDKITELQSKLENTESMLVYQHSKEGGASTISSLSSQSSDANQQDDLLHNVLLVDSQLKDVNSMLLKLRQNFDAYLDSIPDSSRGKAIGLADLVEDIGHRCQDIQDSLHGTSEENTPTDETYKHRIAVNAKSGGEAILAEYQGLKSKFDVVTVEVRKVKKELESVQCSSQSLGKENSRLKEDLGLMEGVLKPQVVDLISKVNALSVKIVNVQTDAVRDSPLTDNLSSSSSVAVITNISDHLAQLGNRIGTLEQQVATVGQNFVSSSGGKSKSNSSSSSTNQLPPAENEGLVLKLEDIKQQLEEVNSKLTALNPFPSDISKSGKECLTQLGDYKERIKSLSKALQSLVAAQKAPAQLQQEQQQQQQLLGGKPSESTDSTLAAEGLTNCLSVIKERIQEVGELLDSLEEDGEDSDSEDDEGEQSGVEEVREKLSSLTEYIEQHSKMSTSEWAILRLLNVQKENLCSTKDVIDSECVSDNEKLKTYCDRLSLEAVILSEMANLIQEKDLLSPEDPVSREIDTLNSQILLLHYQLDNETKTMHFDQPQADLMEAYTSLMAEKILVNGQLYINSLEENPDSAKEASSNAVSSSSSHQPVLLATEALVRSQIDSYIGENLDRSASEILTLPSHLTARAMVQGDLSYALSQLKSRLNENRSALETGPSNYEFTFCQLEERQRKLMESLHHYERQLIHSLAVIIWKESEEMTIVDVPESVLDAMCSELSTIMETHIQRYKEMCRSTTSMHTARKYDIIVHEIRQSREEMLTEIKRHYEAYSKDQTSIRDSSLDVPVQSLDDTINNFGEILSLKAAVKGTTAFIAELLKMGSTVLDDIDLVQDDSNEEEVGGNLGKNLSSFIGHLSEALKMASSAKVAQSKELLKDLTSSTSASPTTTTTQGRSETDRSNSVSSSTSSSLSSPKESTRDLVCRIPCLSSYPERLSDRGAVVVREAVFSAQLTFLTLKLKLAHERDMGHVKARRPLRSSKPPADGEESRDSEDTLDLQTDYEALLMPLEEVLECKHVDEVEVLQVILNQVEQMRADLGSNEAACEQLQLLEQKLHHELAVAEQRHKTHLEVFKQETVQLEKSVEEQQQDRDHFEERCLQLEEELSALQTHHEEDKERMKQDILTAVHAIKSNDEKSGTQLMEKASKLNKELAIQKLSFRKILSGLRNEVSIKDKESLYQAIDLHISAISLVEEEEEDDYQPPLPEQPPPDMTNTAGASSAPSLQPSLSSSDVQGGGTLDLSHHEQEVEQLKKEKEEALAEEMRNTKAALDAMRKAYEEELVIEKSKYKEALVTMYTEEYVTEIRLRHQEEEEQLREELQKLNMHYSGKCEDYKLMEIRLGQIKQDYESHIEQLIQSNLNLEHMLNREMDNIRDFIKNKPSLGSLTTGSATVEEELYDAKIMVRVKDAELQKLRAQVKTQENSLQRTTEEQRQTMTLYMQSLKNAGEAKKQHQEEIQQLSEKLNKVLGSQGLKANIKRTPSFHQRARSPSPQPSSSPRKDSDHSSRESHRRRHIQPKDLRRSKSSPSLPYVFDAKGTLVANNKPSLSKLSSRRSRSPKS